MIINNKKIGVFEGKELVEYTMKNDNGIEVSILNLGGIITKILVPDKNGNFENVVLAYEDYNNYFTNDSCYGAVIGRFAGRIYRGKLNLGNESYKFKLNNGQNHLHGAGEFNNAIWSVNSFIKENNIGIVLEYTSKDGSEGYPGEVKVKVTYALNNDNELDFIVNGTTDKTTVLNITNHSYFNLSGDYKRDVLNQKLKISAKEFSEIDDGITGTGVLLKAKNTPFDFYEEKAIGKDINENYEQLKLANGYDHPFIFDDEIGKVSLKDEESGRVLDVTTNNPVVVIYAMNYPTEPTLYKGVKPTKHLGICFETQNSPIGKDEWGKESSILNPNEEYYRYTTYKFTIIK